MDSVLADFDMALAVVNPNPPEMYIPGFFRNLEVMPGAHEAMAKILDMDHLDIYIGSKPTTGNLNSTIEKYQWIAVNFPRLLQKIVLTCDKGLLRGDYLVDDDPIQWEDKFVGTFIHFNKKHPEYSWNYVTNLLKDIKYEDV